MGCTLLQVAERNKNGVEQILLTTWDVGLETFVISCHDNKHSITPETKTKGRDVVKWT